MDRISSRLLPSLRMFCSAPLTMYVLSAAELITGCKKSLKTDEVDMTVDWIL